MAETIHRIVGGMRVFGTSAEALRGEALERALRDSEHAQAMRHVPEFLASVAGWTARLRAAHAVFTK